MLYWDECEGAFVAMSNVVRDDGIGFEYSVKKRSGKRGGWTASAAGELGMPPRDFQTPAEARTWCEAWDAAAAFYEGRHDGLVVRTPPPTGVKLGYWEGDAPCRSH